MSEPAFILMFTCFAIFIYLVFTGTVEVHVGTHHLNSKVEAVEEEEV